MTLAELHERIGWQLEGRLQHLGFRGEWVDVSDDNTPQRSGEASHFRRRPDAPEMPEEVWVADYGHFMKGLVAHQTRESCQTGNHSATPVRYVRADSVITADKLLVSHDSGLSWNDQSCSMLKYRFKEGV